VYQPVGAGLDQDLAGGAESRTNDDQTNPLAAGGHAARLDAGGICG
jgi:hypothetical protein